MWNRNHKMVGRKPKIHSFIFEEMRKNELTGTFYQFPVKRVFMTVDDPECDGKRYGTCPCIPHGKIMIAHTMDDNDIYSRCMACGDYVFWRQNRLDKNSEYFKWAITGKSNTKLYEELKNE